MVYSLLTYSFPSFELSVKLGCSNLGLIVLLISFASINDSAVYIL